MNRRWVKSLAALVALLLALMPFAAMGEGKTVTDMMGREIVLDGEVTRVVALTAADCEILYALGAESLLVGRGEYCNYPESVLEVPSVESGFQTNIEQIIALAPQVVLMNTMNQPVEQVNQLEAAGIRVVASCATGIDGVYEAITVIGAVTGKDAEAEALIAEMKAGFAQIADEYRDKLAGKSVYFEVSPLEWGLWTAGKNTFMDEIAEMLGMTNAFSELDGWQAISQEQVIARNPDFIVTTQGYYGEGQTPDEEIRSRAGWEELDAVKNGRVILADSDMLSRPGPRLVLAMRAIAEATLSVRSK